MCGIFASVSTRACQHQSGELRELLRSRGPDHIGQVQSKATIKDGATYWLSFTSTVLALRGGHLTQQPFESPTGNSVLCWNGEAWRVGQGIVEGNDGQVIFDLLLSAISCNELVSDSRIAVLEVLKSIAGPFAFFLYDGIHKQIYFGRDRLGRRSLLYNTSQYPESLEFASVGDSASGNWQEVEADGIYILSFTDGPLFSHDRIEGPISLNSISSILRVAWGSPAANSETLSIGQFNRDIPDRAYSLSADSPSVADLKHQLHESLKLRLLNIPVPPGLDQSHNARAAVLFSGGLDCSVLARMAHDIVPADQEIDLLNVAFENPRVVQAAAKAAGKQSQALHISPYEACPDRETGRKAFRELRVVCPGRKWRFIAIDVPYTETVEHRSRVINLIRPHQTEMDLSIAYALYFSARGIGTASVTQEDSGISYATTARVLLSGLGADELFGGYTRHATAFSRRGLPGLLDEIELDVGRLGKRNLGRDDRVISHWGREVRFPYLDESLVKWAVERPIWEKCSFHEDITNEIPQFEPGKRVLRLLADELGMHNVSKEKKRAIQFGTRTAKMEIGKTKGTHLIS
ncbi:asparagine synthase-domain-containing protein [Xylogone sp. PMI_703]|nr:asparagine synthase-domain-containing protein [Xylogone sp. PMI_703]